MLLIYQKINDEITIDGLAYLINASFDNIIKVSELLSDNEASDTDRVYVGLALLLGTDLPYQELPIEQQHEALIEIIDRYLKTKQTLHYDRLGNVIPTPTEEEQEVLFSLKHDSERIYSSFMATYHIDLFEVQGKLHWLKFRAMLHGLPSDSPFKQAVHIRGWKPSDDKKKKVQAMNDAKRQLELPDD